MINVLRKEELLNLMNNSSFVKEKAELNVEEILFWLQETNHRGEKVNDIMVAELNYKLKKHEDAWYYVAAKESIVPLIDKKNTVFVFTDRDYAVAALNAINKNEELVQIKKYDKDNDEPIFDFMYRMGANSVSVNRAAGGLKMDISGVLSESRIPVFASERALNRSVANLCCFLDNYSDEMEDKAVNNLVEAYRNLSIALCYSTLCYAVEKGAASDVIQSAPNSESAGIHYNVFTDEVELWKYYDPSVFKLVRKDAVSILKEAEENEVYLNFRTAMVVVPSFVVADAIDERDRHIEISSILSRVFETKWAEKTAKNMLRHPDICEELVRSVNNGKIDATAESVDACGYTAYDLFKRGIPNIETCYVLLADIRENPDEAEKNINEIVANSNKNK